MPTDDLSTLRDRLEGCMARNRQARILLRHALESLEYRNAMGTPDQREGVRRLMTEIARSVDAPSG
jgi:hypothetical protein